MTPSGNPVRAIGMMSGTSADGIDGVVLNIGPDNRIDISHSHSLPYPADIADQVRDAAARVQQAEHQCQELEAALTDLYAQVARTLLDNLGDPVEVIGCHGQTVHHSPDSEPPFTVQLVDGARLSRLTGHPVVTRFRDADLAAGGQGAPLAPGFHKAAFASADEHRAVINLGGIANITLLPRDPEAPISGYDTGPGNTLLDAWCRDRLDMAFDRDGEQARQGHILLDLLDLCLRDDYFTRPAPKSTGTEYFNLTWLREKLATWDGHGDHDDTDILTTLTALTARTVANEIGNLQPPVERAYACGGGSRNQLLMEMLNDALPFQLQTTGALGVDPQMVEAAAFAWMAHRTINGQTSTLPSVTGASEATVAGIVSRDGVSD